MECVYPGPMQPSADRAWQGDAWRALSPPGTRLWMAKRRWRSSGSAADMELILGEFFLYLMKDLFKTMVPILSRENLQFIPHTNWPCVRFTTYPLRVGFPCLSLPPVLTLCVRNTRTLPCWSGLLCPHSWPSGTLPPASPSSGPWLTQCSCGCSS